MEALIHPHFGLTFWTIFIFILLLILLSKFVWKPMLDAIDAREKKIAGDLEQAKKAREEAEKYKADIEKRLAELKNEIKKRYDEAVYEANTEKEKIIEKAHKQAEVMIENAKKEIEEYKNNVLKEVEEKIVDLAVLVSKRVLNHIVDKKIEEKISETSLKEYREYIKQKN